MGRLSRMFGREERPPRDVAALVAPVSLPAVRMTPTTVAGPATCWCGGRPRLPRGYDWPRAAGEPLAFLAQLDLAQVARLVPLDWLPHTGSLAFFYDAVRQPWGFAPEHGGGWRVVHVVDGEEELAPPVDIDPVCVQPHRPLSLSRVLLPPDAERSEVEQLELDDRELDLLSTYREALFDHGPEHHVGGFPSAVQADRMELECQLVTHGLYCGDPSGYRDPRRAALEPGAADWRLLLQLDSDDGAGWCWGDAGRLYFWVREEEARRGDFGGVWAVLQCT